jgi:hypothetical protein
MTPRITIWLRNYLALSLCVALQLGYWFETKDIRPDLDIVPDVPGRTEIHALTFGDDEFYFRALALMIQNSGDTYGRFSPLRAYDFNKLYLWFNLLDELDARSNMIPAMACYYFSQTQNTADVRYIVDYLYAHATRDVGHKWWWLVQSIYLAMHTLNDKDLALKVAKPLVDPKVPVWAQQMTAVVYEKRGEMDDALRIMNTIQENSKDISDADLKFMTYFIKERIGKLDKMHQAPMAPRDAIGPAPAHPE